jgi:hypothetical protein
MLVIAGIKKKCDIKQWNKSVNEIAEYGLDDQVSIR